MERSRTIERISQNALFFSVQSAMPERISEFLFRVSLQTPSIYLLRPVPGQGKMVIDGLGLGQLSVLPFELLCQIFFEYLDLDSLMCLARVNTALREVVSSLPLMKRIRESQELAVPFILLQNAQTAKFHTLRDFLSSLQTITCHICRIESQFGTLVNLLTLRRVCNRCVSKSHLCLPVPTDLAKNMFGLDERHLQIRSATASRTQVRWRPDPTTKKGYEVKVLHTPETVYDLQDVIDAAVSEFSKPGGPGILGLKHHMEDFLGYFLWPRPHVFNSPGDRLGVDLTENVSVANAIPAIESSWEGRGDDTRYALIASMPHVRLPDTLETGLTCQGCVRDRFHHPHLENASCKANTAFLEEQLLRHIETCESAQMILRGERLRYDEESAEISKFGLHKRMYEIWNPFQHVKVPGHIQEAMDDLQFGVDRTPDRYRLRCAQVEKLIERAKKVQDKQCRGRRSGSPEQA
jgi:hypothetical protein